MFNTENNDIEREILKAKYFAIGAHQQQKRKYTHEPYWYHLQSVAFLLAEYYPENPKAQIVAWLHDVIEDTMVSIFDIQYFFGEEIAKYVSALTEPPQAEGNRAQRKAIYNQQLAQAGELVQTVKYADLIDNTSSIFEHDPDFAKLYLEEKQILLPMINKGESILYHIAKSKAGLI